MVIWGNWFTCRISALRNHRQVALCKLESSLDYTGSYRPARTTHDVQTQKKKLLTLEIEQYVYLSGFMSKENKKIEKK